MYWIPIAACFAVVGTSQDGSPSHQSRRYNIPTIDLAQEEECQVIIDREAGQYLGHPTTVLLKDNETMIVVYPKGHGRGAIVMKRSADAGLTWSDRLPVPENWATSQETPTIYHAVDPKGVERLIMFSGLYPIRMAYSEDEGETWTPLKPIGDFGGIVAMSSLVRLKDGSYMALFHDDGRFLHETPDSNAQKTLIVYKTLSTDGGMTWGQPQMVTQHPLAHPCEPGAVRSPDGNQIALLLRENSRQYNSMVVFSDDEGETWSKPVELPASLTGDRHVARYAPDGRLVVVFRDMAHLSSTRGDFVAWVGTYDDIVQGREGQYRVRLLDNKKGADTGYAGLELLPDGTFVATTYCHLKENEPPLIASSRFRLEEIDAKAAEMMPDQKPIFVRGEGGYHTYRIPALIVTRAGALLAFCEGRKNSGSDHGKIDMMIKRSTDNGETWSEQKVIYAENGGREITIGNPCPVVDQDNGTIWLPFCRDNDDVLITKSVDDGITWSEPVDITKDVKGSFDGWYATGPGVGIQLRHEDHKGRLVIPCDHREERKGKKAMYSHVFYSDDRGETWKLGGTAPPYSDECQVVELEDGTLLLNMRNYWGREAGEPEKGNMRSITTSRDGGESWGDVQFDAALIEPICQASFIRYTDTSGGGRNRLLFSNPASADQRVNMTVRVSYDEGKTWPISKSLHAGPTAYSCLTVLPDMTIGCLYERGDKSPYETIVFARFTLDWLTNGNEMIEE